MANARRHSRQARVQPMAVIPALAIAAVGGYALYRTFGQPERRRYVGDAPSVSLRNRRSAGQLANAVVTIDRPRRELYDYWRDFANLPSFMENVRRRGSGRPGISVDDRGAGRSGSRARLGNHPGHSRGIDYLALDTRVRDQEQRTHPLQGRSARPGNDCHRPHRLEGSASALPASRSRSSSAASRNCRPSANCARFKQLMETGEIATAKAYSSQQDDCQFQPNHDRSEAMKALTWHGKKDVRVETVPGPRDHQSARRNHQGDFDRDLRIGPASL